MTPRRLTEAQIRQHASEESFARGADCYRHGAAEALEVGREQFSTAGEALELAQLLRERGDGAGALSVAERGLELELDAAGGPRQELEKARLAAWLVDLAAGQGRVDLALRAGAEALQVEPELGL